MTSILKGITDMTDTEELERMAASITPGPWMSDGTSVNVPDKRQSSIAVCVRLGTRTEVEAQANARAIAIVPYLLDEVISLRSEVERLDARANAAEADAERLAEAGTVQYEAFGACRNLIEALAAHTQRVNAKEGV